MFDVGIFKNIWHNESILIDIMWCYELFHMVGVLSFYANKIIGEGWNKA